LDHADRARKTGQLSQSLDLNGRLIPVKDPLTNQPFPETSFRNSCEPERVGDPEYSAAAKRERGGYNFIFRSDISINRGNRSRTREDYRPTDKDTISFHAQYVNADSSGNHVAAGSSLWGLLPMRYAFETNQATVNYTRVITPHLINEFFIGAMHDREESPPCLR